MSTTNHTATPGCTCPGCLPKADAVIEQATDGTVWAHHPAQPGVYASGESTAAAFAQLQAAVAFHHEED
jgi:predicted RNase H-like HicB family nuclease